MKIEGEDSHIIVSLKPGERIVILNKDDQVLRFKVTRNRLTVVAGVLEKDEG